MKKKLFVKHISTFYIKEFLLWLVKGKFSIVKFNCLKENIFHSLRLYKQQAIFTALRFHHTRLKCCFCENHKNCVCFFYHCSSSVRLMLILSLVLLSVKHSWLFRVLALVFQPERNSFFCISVSSFFRDENLPRCAKKNHSDCESCIKFRYGEFLMIYEYQNRLNQ